jgi:hypothetical protein
MNRRIIICLALAFSVKAFAQTLNSIAITAGATAANQKFLIADPASVSRKQYLFGINASVFAEIFSRDRARWVTEIQYNQKGSIDKREEQRYTNKLHYICWNNYLKLRYEMFSIIPYLLLGPRLEFNIIQATSSPEIGGKFLPLHVSPAVGAGFELVSYYNIKFFTEAFYNPGAMPAYISTNTHVLNNSIELRVGLKYEMKTRAESCNTPTYIE